MPPFSEADDFVQGTWQPGVGDSCYRHVMLRYVNRVVSFFDSFGKIILWTFLFRSCTELERVGLPFLQLFFGWLDGRRVSPAPIGLQHPRNFHFSRN